MEVIAIAATSLDGFITRGNEPGTAFTSQADKEWFSGALKTFHAKVMGRKTFEISRDCLLEQIRNGSTNLRIVRTRSPQQYARLEISDRLHFTSAKPAEILQAIADSGRMDSKVAILGGGSTYGAFLDAGLLDEFWITLEPQLFGSGTPLLEGSTRHHLELQDTIQLAPSTLLLKYKVPAIR